MGEELMGVQVFSIAEVLEDFDFLFGQFLEDQGDFLIKDEKGRYLRVHKISRGTDND